MKHMLALVTGLVFGTGIAISGMMDPAKVLNFFDIAQFLDLFTARLPAGNCFKCVPLNAG